MTPLFPLDHYPDQDALLDMEEGRRVTYREIKEIEERFSFPRSLIFLFTQNHWQEVAAYVALINQGHVLCLLDGRLERSLKERLVALYQPSFILGMGEEWGEPGPSPVEGLPLFRKKNEAPHMYKELRLLLSTSGTTGSPKMVRLSGRNLLNNAAAIIGYLGISSHERALASLPIHYSYGLSVLHTHLLAGATTLLTRKSIVQREFWHEAAQFQASSFAGVPYTYEILDRIGFETFSLPALKTMTQAGGALSKELILKFHHLMQNRGGRFFVMYGQTEATARISYLPPEALPEKVGTIGKAIPGVLLRIEQGELVCEGPNVMLGLANSAEDLALGDQLEGILHTGDLGFCDEEGFFTVTGRSKRIAKVYGQRLNLDELEAMVKSYATVAITSDDRQIILHFEGTIVESCVKLIAEKSHLHYSTFRTVQREKLPRTPSGKIDYAKL